jgi:Family of unknown function (DUF6364)
VVRRNLTLQLDEETIRQAKLLAASRGTSISGLVARELELLVARDARYEEARRRAVELMAKSVAHGGRSWRRGYLYQDEGPWSTLR